jgi:hypothetical protein
MDERSPPGPPEATRVLLAVPPPEIAYFHAVLEGYDDLAVMRTLAPEEGLVEVYISSGAEEDFAGLLAALRDEGIPIREIGGDGGYGLD